MDKKPDTFDKKAKKACEYNAELMKLERKRKGLTQKEMAEEIGVALNYIGNLENSHVKIPLYIVLEYSRILGIPASRFVASEETALPTNDEVLFEYDRLPNRLKAYVFEFMQELGR